jgi:two-component system response regulator
MTRTDAEILLVEDNANDAELTFRAFRRQGIRNKMLLAKDGAEALDLLLRRGAYAGREEEPAPRLVLLDLRLPKVDGIEVLREMKSNERTRRIPVVVLTTSRQDQDIRECYALGANSYIVKPMDFNNFGEAVCQLGLYWLLLNELPK